MCGRTVRVISHPENSNPFPVRARPALLFSCPFWLRSMSEAALGSLRLGGHSCVGVELWVVVQSPEAAKKGSAFVLKIEERAQVSDLPVLAPTGQLAELRGNCEALRGNAGRALGLPCHAGRLQRHLQYRPACAPCRARCTSVSDCIKHVPGAYDKRPNSLTMSSPVANMAVMRARPYMREGLGALRSSPLCGGICWGASRGCLIASSIIHGRMF